VIAYVLVQTDVGVIGDVAGEIAGIKGVVAAEAVTGPSDVIAKAEANSLDELGGLVIQRIQLVAGVSRTLTCPVLHE
jgi:DNA-binding Lrp family transcriptional regulator